MKTFKLSTQNIFASKNQKESVSRQETSVLQLLICRLEQQMLQIVSEHPLEVSL
jgi:hypothetical protein